MIIYKTTDITNGKFYVGQDRHNDPAYLGSGLLLRKAIEKYGFTNFKKEILEVCSTQEQLNQREIYWITELRATERGVGYNIAAGGTGGDTFTNNPNKEEWRRKNGLTMLGKKNPHSAETKKKISTSVKLSWQQNPYQGSTGTKRTEEVRAKISRNRKGIIPEKIKCNHCGRSSDPGNYAKHHGVKCRHRTCYICGKTVNATVYSRYHGQKCKG